MDLKYKIHVNEGSNQNKIWSGSYDCLHFPDDLIQYTAMTWLREFIGQAGRTMIQYTPGIINAVLPHLQGASDKQKKYPSLNRRIRILCYCM